MEHGEEPALVALDGLLDHDVGGGDPPLRTGVRESAAELFAVLAVPSREDADPWWSYHYERVPASRAWLSNMWDAFREATR